MRGASSGGLPLSVSSSATTSPRPGDRGFESRPSSGESTANPVGLAQVEWPVRRRRSLWQAQRCGWRRASSLRELRKPVVGDVGPPRDPGVAPVGNMPEDPVEGADAAGSPDHPQVKADRHHLRHVRPLAMQPAAPLNRLVFAPRRASFCRLAAGSAGTPSLAIPATLPGLQSFATAQTALAVAAVEFIVRDSS
jgi:hypothetical protein